MIKGITAYAASQGANKQASCEPSALQEAGQAAWSSAPPLDAAPSSCGPNSDEANAPEPREACLFLQLLARPAAPPPVPVPVPFPVPLPVPFSPVFSFPFLPHLRRLRWRRAVLRGAFPSLARLLATWLQLAAPHLKPPRIAQALLEVRVPGDPPPLDAGVEEAGSGASAATPLGGAFLQHHAGLLGRTF